MYKKKKILGLVPARGGSKGLPGKNIRPLSGKPLIAWTLEQALVSKHIDKVFVSTDDAGIAEISIKYGAEVPFLRPPELARDDSPSIDTVIHTLEYFENKDECFDIVALLEPTSPLRKKEDLDNALSSLVDNMPAAEAVISLGEIHMENPFIAKIVKGGVIKSLMEESNSIFQRQQLPKIFFPYGVIYASTVSSLKKTKTFYPEASIPYYIERWQNYEIDDIYDFICIEAILQNKLMEMR